MDGLPGGRGRRVRVCEGRGEGGGRGAGERGRHNDTPLDALVLEGMGWVVELSNRWIGDSSARQTLSATLVFEPGNVHS